VDKAFESYITLRDAWNGPKQFRKRCATWLPGLQSLVQAIGTFVQVPYHHGKLNAKKKPSLKGDLVWESAKSSFSAQTIFDCFSCDFKFEFTENILRRPGEMFRYCHSPKTNNKRTIRTEKQHLEHSSKHCRVKLTMSFENWMESSLSQIGSCLWEQFKTIFLFSKLE